MQKVYTPRLPLLPVNLYSAAPRRGCPANRPNCERLIKSCGCSMRTPTAKGFGTSSIPFETRRRYVSRAACPIASTAAQHGSFSFPLTVTETMRPSRVSKSVMQELKRISTPML